MLVSFTLENWMSFRDKNFFDMIASRERQHRQRVPRLDEYQASILPIAAIYGGNASGKTNFFRALNFAKHFIVEGTKRRGTIPVDTFLLDDEIVKKPSSFAFEILVDQTLYEFSFTVTKEKVLSEKLVEIKSTSEKILYDRNGKEPKFDKSLADNGLLNFAFQGTRDNQLFLTNSVSQGIDQFEHIYEWFSYTLQLVAPDSRFAPFELFITEDNPIYNLMNQALQRLDTGIYHLGSVEIEFDNIPIPKEDKDEIREEIENNMTYKIEVKPINQRFLVSLKNGNLIAKKLATFHKKVDGAEIKFDMHQESDGSQRAIDLLPAFLHLTVANQILDETIESLDETIESSKVYVIDEIDRSLHPLLVYKLLEDYLDTCSEVTRSQLLLTTHSLELMDQLLLRRDEMWLTERNRFGASKLFSVSKFKDVSSIKDIRKIYLQGQMGGIPNISLEDIFDNYSPS